MALAQRVNALHAKAKDMADIVAVMEHQVKDNMGHGKHQQEEEGKKPSQFKNDNNSSSNSKEEL